MTPATCSLGKFVKRPIMASPLPLVSLCGECVLIHNYTVYSNLLQHPNISDPWGVEYEFIIKYLFQGCCSLNVQHSPRAGSLYFLFLWLLPGSSLSGSQKHKYLCMSPSDKWEKFCRTLFNRVWECRLTEMEMQDSGGLTQREWQRQRQRTVIWSS